METKQWLMQPQQTPTEIGGCGAELWYLFISLCWIQQYTAVWRNYCMIRDLTGFIFVFWQVKPFRWLKVHFWWLLLHPSKCWKPTAVAHSEAYSSPAGFAGQACADCLSVHMVTFISHGSTVAHLSRKHISPLQLLLWLLSRENQNISYAVHNARWCVCGQEVILFI